MRLDDFRALVDRLKQDVPSTYLTGVVEVEVSPKTVPHAIRGDVYTLGECIPMEWSGSGADLQSRVVLYHGSFVALAHLDDAFDWREEAWETLTHELKHHIEWRANAAALERYDWAAEQNFARQEGDTFDPTFYREGEEIGEGVFKVEDDVFVERGRGKGEAGMVWHGKRYRVEVPPDVRPPAFLVLNGLDDPPAGDAVLVLPRSWSLLDLFRHAPEPVQIEATVKRET
jgi:zinicin-like metallopeptidase